MLVLEIQPIRPPGKPPAMNLPSSRAPVLRRAGHEREERRILVMAMLRSGLSYETVARDHELSPERVRQIVVASLERKYSGTQVGQMRVRMARLEPALRLARSEPKMGGATDRGLRSRRRRSEGKFSSSQTIEKSRNGIGIATSTRASARFKSTAPLPAPLRRDRALSLSARS